MFDDDQLFCQSELSNEKEWILLDVININIWISHTKVGMGLGVTHQGDIVMVQYIFRVFILLIMTLI